MTKKKEVFGRYASTVIAPQVVIDSGLAKVEKYNALTRLVISRHPGTNQKTAVLFSDDGRGNGLPLLYFDL